MAKAKRVKGIKCDDAAVAGIRLVLTTRFAEMLEFRQAALDFSDPEGVHSMRVASRRLRSAMRDFLPYIRKRELTSLIKQTKSIAAALGEVRDQDVAIAALEKIEKHAPAEASVALKQIIDTRKAGRDTARKSLKSILVPNLITQLRSEFVAGIEGATALRKTKAPLTFAKMSAEVIGERLQELEALSNSLYKPFEVESLHDMRIAAKRLRYALELFQQCWGRALVTHARQAAKMQKALGDLHDCDTWIDNIGEQVNEARKQKHGEIEGLIWLLSHFVKLRTKHLRQAYDLWREWEANEVGDQLRQTLQARASE